LAVTWKKLIYQDDLDTHAAAADPHTVYQKESEKGAASGYASLDAGTKVPTAELGGAGADNTKYLRGDQSWQVPAGGGYPYWQILVGETITIDARQEYAIVSSVLDMAGTISLGAGSNLAIINGGA